MPRQARADVTRRKIITAAVDLFSEIGYPATGLGEIIERADMTKGALYYHFDSKEALAEAIITEGGASTLAAFHNITESSSPALENLIHGLFVVCDFTRTDRVAEIGLHLLQTFAGINDATERVYASWLDAISGQLHRAAAEGDLREGLDPGAAAEVILEAALGAEALSRAGSSGTDLRERIVRIWDLLLPAVVNPDSLEYFREFLARESLRRSPGAD
ncbi:ScbR family autoregulator-binding transcription factor [Mycolicibacterium goodii]|uniref:TetR/AcrR family transcriptional regulator n=1 Tax=Mycolicibacterium goodii TaxID=134601 RepID=A0ABS6HPG0_MYCGD|nr:ScbR family autoregulator-binding transcription factor [Mycolicibacterium goodii]MBU8809561.1 TetR/AcrR family transcriptional regulator [Mycolicibacterium goodii]MBU8819646.1 TetR/AcrR family transcriptional regulator [Mycolicibacterium goodii]MBU8824581.1 TetR/AcrR family transcriptional regulator [Mycolicibacterium goodii]MBU8830770.1 TetR/AcrR family transcriptional regulator [Mycolicibacterium goodii]MBU8837168.1 TetR/AcrR family transcriptional regulator [Mycolicibacterium goodii]